MVLGNTSSGRVVRGMVASTRKTRLGKIGCNAVTICWSGTAAERDIAMLSPCVSAILTNSIWIESRHVHFNAILFI